MLHLVSRLILLKAGKEAGWNVPQFQIFAVHPEYNVWDRFETRFETLLRGKEESNEVIKKYTEAKNYQDLLLQRKGENILYSTRSATDLDNIPDDSIDYVFTDPPYGGIIQYYELDTLRAAWLAGKQKNQKFDSWWESEITINANQKKNADYYHSRLHTAFREIYRVLKPEKYLTVTFTNTEVAIYNSIIRATLFAGFNLEKIIYQPTNHISSKAGFHPYTSIVGDFYLRFKKPIQPVQKLDDQEVDEERARKIILLVLIKILAGRGEPVTFTELLKGQSTIYQELEKLGYKFFGSNPDNIQKVLNDNRGKEFEFIEGQGWWFKEPHKHHLNVALNDRVEEIVLQRLRRSESSFTDILQDIYIKFTNSLTPNPASVKEFVYEYGEKTTDGKWRLKPEVSSSINEHSMVIADLAILGQEYGYDVWIGARERGQIFKKKELSSYSTISNLNLKDASQKQIEQYLKQIDILWIKNDMTYYAIEVEYSTAVTEAFNRCSNLPHTKHDINRVIIIPKERQQMLQRKINSVLIKERMEKEQWKFIFYDKFLKFFLNSRRRETSASEFLRLATPIQGEEGNSTLDKFQYLC